MIRFYAQKNSYSNVITGIAIAIMFLTASAQAVIMEIMWNGSAWVKNTVNQHNFVSICDRGDAADRLYGAKVGGGLCEIAWNGSAWVEQTISTDTFVSVSDRVALADRLYGAKASGGLYEIMWNGSAWVYDTLSTDTYVSICENTSVPDRVYGAKAGGGVYEIGWTGSAWYEMLVSTNTYISVSDKVGEDNRLYGVRDTGAIYEIRWNYSAHAWFEDLISDNDYVAVADRTDTAESLYGLRADGSIYEITRTGSVWNEQLITSNSYNAIADNTFLANRLYAAIMTGSHCGDPGTDIGSDINGPFGIPDCYVDMFDLTELAEQWLRCTDPQNAECDYLHDLTNRNSDAIQTVYRNGVPHTNRRGVPRMTYNPVESFFPIGMWGVVLPGTHYGCHYDWQDLVDAGFNTVWPWQPYETYEDLQAGLDNGLQVILMRPQTSEIIESIKNHPNLLGNVWQDEPTGVFWGDDMQGYFDDFLSYKSMANSIAPDMLVFVNDTPWIMEPATNWWIQWNTSGDVSCHDNYPIKPITHTMGYNPNGVPQVVSFAVSHNNEQKPVWLVVGAFEIREPPDTVHTARFPTVEQLRANVYTGLIHGVTGIHYFIWDSFISRPIIGISSSPVVDRGVGGVLPSPLQMARSKELWDAASQINSEISQLSPSLLSATAGPEIVYQLSITGQDVTDAPVRTLLKTNPAGGYVLLTVNLDRSVLKVTYTFNDTLSVVQPLFENRGSAVLSSDRHSFVENYEPFDTHVFQINFNANP